MDDVKVRVATAKQSTATVMDVLLPRDKKGRGWQCPSCGNGSGEDGDGLLLVPPYRQRAHCFRCGWGGDVLDIAGEVLGLKTFREKLEAVEALVGCTTTISPRRTQTTATAHKTQDYTEFFEEAHSHVHETDYFQRRGLSAGTIDRFNLGFASQKVQGKDWEAAIIPTSACSFTARNTDPAADHGNRYRKRGPTCIYNPAALYQDAPCWIAEGEINALSLLELGANAAALGSSADWKKLISEIDHRRPTVPIIIALDNDDAGNDAAGKLSVELKKRCVTYSRPVICRREFDINDELLADRDGLQERIIRAEGGLKWKNTD